MLPVLFSNYLSKKINSTVGIKVKVEEKKSYEIIVTNRGKEFQFENFQIRIIRLLLSTLHGRKFRDILNFPYFRIIFTFTYRVVLKLGFQNSWITVSLIKLKVNKLTSSRIPF